MHNNPLVLPPSHPKLPCGGYPGWPVAMSSTNASAAAIVAMMNLIKREQLVFLDVVTSPGVVPEVPGVYTISNRHQCEHVFLPGS